MQQPGSMWLIHVLTDGSLVGVSLGEDAAAGCNMAQPTVKITSMSKLPSMHYFTPGTV